jgi:hypothetical protein
LKTHAGKLLSMVQHLESVIRGAQARQIRPQPGLVSTEDSADEVWDEAA